MLTKYFGLRDAFYPPISTRIFLVFRTIIFPFGYLVYRARHRLMGTDDQMGTMRLLAIADLKTMLRTIPPVMVAIKNLSALLPVENMRRLAWRTAILIPAHFCRGAASKLRRFAHRRWQSLTTGRVGSEPRWIGVDLDGTLAEYSGWISIRHVGDPVPVMLERVKAWLEEGIEVRIFTARVCHPAWRTDGIYAIRDWCEKHGLPRLRVTNAKDFGMIELWDDRAVRVETNSGRRVDQALRSGLLQAPYLYREKARWKPARMPSDPEPCPRCSGRKNSGTRGHLHLAEQPQVRADGKHIA
jgi:hypothetical protein